MRYKNLLRALQVLCCLVLATLSACSARCLCDPSESFSAPQLDTRVEARQHEDGIYRGIFADGDSIQVNVQFVLRDGIIQEASFRHLRRDENYRMGVQDEPYRSVVAQYKEALQHLVGKPLAQHLRDLYSPGEIVTVEADGYSGATIRSSKLLSAIRDALNRGPYGHI